MLFSECFAIRFILEVDCMDLSLRVTRSLGFYFFTVPEEMFRALALQADGWPMSALPVTTVAIVVVLCSSPLALVNPCQRLSVCV